MDKPRVKPLEWSVVKDDFRKRDGSGKGYLFENFEARCPATGFSYQFLRMTDTKGKHRTFIDERQLESIAAAKEHFKARHETRILAALEPAPVSVQEAVQVLGALPPNELRPILSNLANMTPDVVYYPNDFLSGFPDKKDGEGTSMGKTGQAALFLANSLAEHIEPGGEAVIRLGSISHGNQNNGDWTVTAFRALAGDEGER